MTVLVPESSWPRSPRSRWRSAGASTPARGTRVEAEINPAIRDIARRRGLILADNHALFAGRPDLLPDIHPSEEGYRVLAEAWHRILAPLLSSAPRERTGAR